MAYPGAPGMALQPETDIVDDASSHDGVHWRHWIPRILTRRLFWFMLLFELLMIGLFYAFVDYQPVDTPALLFNFQYAVFQDVHVMIFIGFGFLMTFLARYSWSAVGFTFLLAAMAVQWAVLTRNFFHFLLVEREFAHNIRFGVLEMILAEFAAGSFLISYGAVLGIFSSTQLIAMMFAHIPGYALIEALVVRVKGVDPGGAMVLHAYGAYFGLTVSFFALFKRKLPGGTAGSSRVHALFSMIGTIFLYLFWPSFNSAIAFNPERAAVNTYLSLTGSVVGAFLISWAFRHGGRFKFDMEDVQNATLAGGVVMGAACDFFINPASALLTGFVTGIISALGFIFLSRYLHNLIGLRDTCGVHNLHGIPGVLGGLMGVVGALHAAEQSGLAFGDRSNAQQAGIQLGCLGIALGIAFIWGAITGLILRLPWFFEENESELYEDRVGPCTCVVVGVRALQGKAGVPFRGSFAVTCRACAVSLYFTPEWHVHAEGVGFDKGGHLGKLPATPHANHSPVMSS